MDRASPMCLSLEGVRVVGDAALRVVWVRGCLVGVVQEAYMFNAGIGVMWYATSVKPVDFKKNPFRHMAAFFSVWHEPLRGANMLDI